MKQRLLLALALPMMLGLASLTAATRISETEYDWAPIAKEIVGKTSDKREQAYKIYRWLCDNIAYDTSHTVRTSDSCYLTRRGVCQGFTELFYRIGEPLGLKTVIVSGIAKNADGTLDTDGHAWLYVYTDRKNGIFIDPTWGAGSVDDGVFVRSKDDDSWFDVDPYWLIFSHFPYTKQADLQMLPITVDSLTFCTLPSYRPKLSAFGQDGKQLFEQCCTGSAPDLPKYYPTVLPMVEVGTMPLEGTLRVGQSYTFSLRPTTGGELMIQNGKQQSFSKEWEQQDGMSVCRFMPSDDATVTVAIKTGGGNEWSVLAQYKMAHPTTADIENLEAADPKLSPAFKGLANYSAKTLADHGVDFAALLREIKEQGITRLPVIYAGAKFDIRRMPWNGTLRVGQSYTFCFVPHEEGQWAVINGDDWQMEWKDDDGGRTITVTPQTAGKLQVAAQVAGSENYQYCIEYTVE